MGGVSSLNPAYRQAGGMYWIYGIVGKFLMNETERCLLSFVAPAPARKRRNRSFYIMKKPALL